MLINLVPSKLYSSTFLQRSPIPIQLERWHVLHQTMVTHEKKYVPFPGRPVQSFQDLY
ncbi:hypothetical protein HMI55_005242, partial [Coelomomyces lativittatus]